MQEGDAGRRICSYNYVVRAIRFEWDENKNLANQRKHGISFEDAVEVFDDPLQVLRPDRIKDGEERWQTLGVINGVVLLVVVHTLQDEDDRLTLMRIISARRADRQERRMYEDEDG